MTRVGIIGIGWLGTYLAEQLSDDCQIWGTNRHKEKLPGSLLDKIEWFPYELGGKLESLPFADTDYLIFTIPPSRIADYGSQCIALFQAIRKANPKLTIVYISSTSLYGDQVGELNENSSTAPTSANAQKMEAVENFLQENEAYILRCGGLIGEGRHPVYALSGRTQIAKPNAAVNLIHQEEINGFVRFIIAQQPIPAIYNVVCPMHPDRKEYYQEVARELGIKVPDFDEDDPRKGKIVIPMRMQETGYEFMFRSPFDMPLIRK